MIRSRIFPILVFGMAFGLAMPAHAQKTKLKKNRKAKEATVKTGGKSRIKEAGKAQNTDSLREVRAEELAVIDSILVPVKDSSQPAKKYYTAVKESHLLSMENRLSVMRTRLELAEADLNQRQEQYEAGEEGANTVEELALARTKLDFAKGKLAESEARLVMVREKMEDLGRLGLEDKTKEIPVFEEDIDDDEMEETGAQGQGSGKGAIKGGGKGAIKGGGQQAPAPEGGGKGAIKGDKRKKRRKDKKKETVVPDTAPEEDIDD